jgi:hypothetical protein
MRTLNYFETECCTCGRKLQVRVEYMGKNVLCPQCHGQFVANDPLLSSKKPMQQLSLLERADQLLAPREASAASTSSQPIS